MNNASHLSEIIKGKRSITKPVADKLEVILGIPSIEWVNLQTRFDYDTQKNEERQIAEQVCSPILTHVPLKREYDRNTLVNRLLSL